MDWESEGTSVCLHVWLGAQDWRKHFLDLPATLLQLQHFMVEENTTVCLGCPHHSQSQHSGPWGPPLRQGFPSSLNDGHMPQCGQLSLNPQRKCPGIGPYWKFPFDWVVDDLKGPFWLGNPLRLWSQSTPVALQNSGERRQHYRKLSSGEVGLGADAWPRPAAPLGSVFVKIVTLPPPPDWFMGQLESSFQNSMFLPSTININMCTGPRLPLICVH